MKGIITFIILLISLSTFGQDTINLNTDLSRKERILQDNFIRKNLIGKWKDQNSTISFYPNNSYAITFDADSLKQTGFWEVKKGRIILTVNSSYFEIRYKLLSFTKFKMQYQEIGTNADLTIWIADKIAHFK